jgi:hypothetical protein
MRAGCWRIRGKTTRFAVNRGSTIEAMARRLADLESLILSTHMRERNAEPSSMAAPPPTFPRLPSPDRKPATFMTAPTTKQITRSRDESPDDDAASPPGAEHSLVEVNNETHGVEYYGGSGSLAILDRLYKRARRQSAANRQRTSTASTKPSVVNLLHNPDFEYSPTAPHASPDGVVHTSEPISSRLIEGGFLNAFFDTLHYMHPVVDKNHFLEKCDKGALETENDFAALYYACLAVASITSPEKDPKLSGYSPIQWANMYVDRAKKSISPKPSVVDFRFGGYLFRDNCGDGPMSFAIGISSA